MLFRSGMDGSFVSSVWGNYELVRNKLDKSGYHHKSVLAAESWVSWDDGGSAVDVNGDGIKNEKDAFDRTLTIIGNCMERGLNTIQLPWSDNSSSWAMGLTKRRDYNGRIKEIAPDLVVPANDGGPDIVTQKIGLAGNDTGFQIRSLEGNVFTIDDYINPPDPNHLHYYVWRWFARIAASTDEVIRHAVAGEVGNDISVTGSGFTGNERYRIASYNRTKKSFRVLIYASGANGKTFFKVSIPSTIQTGLHSNTGKGLRDFRGEGFHPGEAYQVRIITKNISNKDGSDVHLRASSSKQKIVEDGVLLATVPSVRQFTIIDFVPVPRD